jgi:hypothetical protein
VRFKRRVATNVPDWLDTKDDAFANDRTPVLDRDGKEPADWPDRFCEVNDDRLEHFVKKVVKASDRKDK